MPFFLQVVDEAGQPAPNKQAIADLLVENIIPRGIGLFRTTAHVEQDIRDGIEAVVFNKDIRVLPVTTRVCPKCGKAIAVWNTYANGSVSCVACK